jgi:hypothetical protein
MHVVLPIQLVDGSVPTAADFMTLYQYLADIIEALPASAETAALPRSYGVGCTLSNNGVDAANDLDIAAGAWRADDDTEDLILTTGLTKRLDAAWAVGSAAGGLDTGTATVTTWYHVWLIKRPDTGAVDALFSTSATGPTMPANYTKKRRLGAVLTDATPAIIAFVQQGDDFRWNDSTGALDFNTTSGTSANTVTHRVPPGVVVQVFGGVAMSTTSVLYVSSLDTPDLAPSTTAWPLGDAGFGSGTPGNDHNPWSCKTNTSGQTRWRASATGTLRVATYGWIDRRGRDV